MNWCMVFGSHGCNSTHWKKLSLNEQEGLAKSFRDGLFRETGLDEERWLQYWKSVTTFRDKFVAHRELHFSEPVPDFDMALDVAYYYDKWVRQIISPAILDEQFAMSQRHSVIPLVKKLVRVTEEPPDDRLRQTVGGCLEASHVGHSCPYLLYFADPLGEICRLIGGPGL
jgi:hypothetical protein